MKNIISLKLMFVVVLAITSASALQCKDGELPFDNLCVPISFIEGCAQYAKDNQCVKCEYGYTLNAGMCQVNNNQNEDCCGAYNNDGVCTQCNSGLYFSSPYCMRENIYGCIYKQGNKCLVCGKGFFLNQGQCLTMISNCQNYKPEGECVACKENYQLIHGYCVEWPKVKNCKLQNQYGCFQCNPGFFLTVNKTCVQYQPGCLQYWREKCLVCITPFELTNQGKCTIFACHSYSQQACAKCHDGWILQNGICHSNNCIRVANTKCIECKSGYRLSSQGCLKETTTFQCISCATGYRFKDGKCIIDIFGCLEYTTDGKCKVCKENFDKTNTGECQIYGCGKYDQNGCIQCNKPFMLNKDKCYIPFCSKYGNGQCTCCLDGYLLSNGVCLSRDPYCQKYSNDNTTCVQCVAKYFLKNGKCYQGQRGCIYDVNGECKCATGFLKDNQGACVILGCASYDSADKCISCQNPFTYNSKNMNCQIAFCSKYAWTGCAQCQNGYILINGRCTLSDKYCVSADRTGKCQKCQDGFFYHQTSNKCFKIIDNCVSIDSDQITCVKCKDGYLLCDGVCKQSLPNCLQQTINPFKCTQCSSGYHLENGLCVKNNQFCSKYKKQNNNEICEECIDGYFLSNDNCYKKAFGCIYKGDKCWTCNRPFFYIKKNETCFIPGCKTLFENGCKQCVGPFKLVDNTCVIENCLSYTEDSCQTCKPNYQLSNGLCVEVDPNCQTYDKGECKLCKNGFVLIGGKCFVADPNCNGYKSDGSCFKCKESCYFDINNKCQPKDHGCVYNNGKCAYCMPPFIYDSAASTCRISYCQKTDENGCVCCKEPFELTPSHECSLPNCLNINNGVCAQCQAQYHLKVGRCLANHPDCRSYNLEGDCQLCRQGLTLTSNGECANMNSICTQTCSSDKTKCLACASGYFLNRFYQCEKEDGSCAAYTNGVCSKCSERYFLYNEICFPYTAGCVQYNGKDCVYCRDGYTLKNGECFRWKNEDMSLLGVDDNYNFSITPIDVRQSKYYIDNLSPATAFGTYYFSSFFNSSYQDASLTTMTESFGKGWKSKYQDDKSYIGVEINDTPVTFYALQLQNIENYFIQEFYIQYSVDGISYIKVETPFKISKNNSTINTIYFTGLYAKSIRIRISKYQGWPACRIQFFYYDLLRYRKISNLKSLKYLQQTINSNFVDRVDNQLYINQAYFFNPSASCSNKDMCFTGLQLCQPHKITQVTLSVTGGTLTEFYLTYSIDGRNYNCYEGCKKIQVTSCTNGEFSYTLPNGLQAEGVRIYPTKYQGSLKFSPTFYYK